MKNKQIKIIKEDKNWTEAYPVLSRVINEHKLQTGIEIGVAYGGHAEYILKNTQLKKLYGVDPYKHIWGYNDPMNFYFWKFNKIYESMLSRLSIFKDRFVIIRKKSKDALGDINEIVDFIYIDADHSYNGVKNDIERWFNKVRIGGFISGHDYGHPNFPGVKIAIDDFFKKYKWNVNHDKSGVWWVQKKNTPISFIIPAYNCERTIRESVNSIIDTNFESGDEIIIVDDKSTDNTLDILKEIASSNSSIKIIENEKNLGGGSTRNTAVKNSKNDLIFCLDSDNILEKNSISILREKLIQTDSDIVSFGEIHFFNEKTEEITHKWKYKNKTTEIRDFFNSSHIPPSSGNYLFKKESWQKSGGYPEFAGALDTWGFGFRQIANNAKMIIVPNTYYFHRHGHQSYWIRYSKNSQLSNVAYQIIKQYEEKINPKILKFIKNNPYEWFNYTNSNYKIKKMIKKIINGIKHKLKKQSDQEIRVIPWFKNDGDKTLRLNYELNESSVVVDVGGYEGQWASDIFAKYCSTILIFEPVKSFADKIKARFRSNSKIKVYDIGLSNQDKDINISLLGDSSSIYKEDSNSEYIKIVDSSKFFNDNNIQYIDLMKINIEGSEYELLENLISSGFIKKIKNIQVQFHDFVPNAKDRMTKIQKELSKTHHTTYQYEFVWENWEINN
ncbi:MAG: FkbM family methyltransferase [Candidatus Paceibacterota bacterium]